MVFDGLMKNKYNFIYRHNFALLAPLCVMITVIISFEPSMAVSLFLSVLTVTPSMARLLKKASA